MNASRGAQANPWATARAVVISDHPEAVEPVVTQLETWGAAPAAAFEPSRALRALSAATPDLVVLDYGSEPGEARSLLGTPEEVRAAVPASAAGASLLALAPAALAGEIQRAAWAPVHIAAHSDLAGIQRALTAVEPPAADVFAPPAATPAEATAPGDFAPPAAIPAEPPVGEIDTPAAPAGTPPVMGAAPRGVATRSLLVSGAAGLALAVAGWLALQRAAAPQADLPARPGTSLPAATTPVVTFSGDAARPAVAPPVATAPQQAVVLPPAPAPVQEQPAAERAGAVETPTDPAAATAAAPGSGETPPSPLSRLPSAGSGPAE